MQQEPNTTEKLGWRDAIETVLGAATEPMHYTDIAEEVATRKLRGSDLGATPPIRFQW